MDIETLRTLLEVNRTRHFRLAAEELFVTQSAVSARIKKLEEHLGVSLFERQHRDIHPTPEGRRLLRHAESMIALWRKARQDVALANQAQIQLAIGGVVGLWDVLLQPWVEALRQRLPALALILEAYGTERVLRRMIDGALDVVCVYEPPQLEEFLIDEMATIPLIMVSTFSGQTADQALATDYVMVDWGQMHALQHARQFPDAPAPAHRISQASIALSFILKCGGAAYLAEQMIASHLQAGVLFPVSDAPPIKRVAYAVYPRRSGRLELIRKVLEYFEPMA